MDILHPAQWLQPKGYSNGVSCRGRMIFLAGQVGWDGDRAFRAADMVGQTRQALANILEVLGEAGGRPEHIVRMTWYVTDKRAYRAAAKQIGQIYQELMGRYYPAMTCVEVKSLMEDEAVVEIEATALIPEGCFGN